MRIPAAVRGGAALAAGAVDVAVGPVARRPSSPTVRLRALSPETLLLAIGTSKPGERTAQLILIHRSALKTFIPWLDQQLQ